MNLFCFPFSGGSCRSYEGLGDSIDFIRVTTFELPGHGRRAREPLLQDVEPMVDDLFRQLHGRLDDPYALFGHSLGASLAHLLTRRIAATSLRLPTHLFLSGRRAPSVGGNRETYNLPQPEFFDILRQLGGCPPEILADADLMAFFEPILRADFRASETQAPSASPPIDVPILLMHGQDNDVSSEEAAPWQLETTHPLLLKPFPGDHFFIFDQWPAIRRLILQCVRLVRKNVTR